MRKEDIERERKREMRKDGKTKRCAEEAKTQGDVGKGRGRGVSHRRTHRGGPIFELAKEKTTMTSFIISGHS